jgi:hypothetical protein
VLINGIDYLDLIMIIEKEERMVKFWSFMKIGVL